MSKVKVNVDEIVSFLCSIGSKRKLLPLLKYLNLEEYSKGTKTIINNGMRGELHVHYVADKLIKFWYPGLIVAMNCYDGNSEVFEYVLPLSLALAKNLKENGYPQYDD